MVRGSGSRLTLTPPDQGSRDDLLDKLELDNLRKRERKETENLGVGNSISRHDTPLRRSVSGSPLPHAHSAKLPNQFIHVPLKYEL